MSIKHVAALVVCVGVSLGSAVAQRNEISATFGKIFVSSQQVKNANFFDPNIHFGNGMTIGGKAVFTDEKYEIAPPHAVAQEVSSPRAA